MRVLIVEDDVYNAFCLRRLLESNFAGVLACIVTNSQDALSILNAYVPDLVIIDGELELVDEWSSHGPQLAAVFLKNYSSLPIIGWSDSEFMLRSFAKVFMQHNRLVNEYNIWDKAVSLETVHKSWSYYFGDFIGETQPSYTYGFDSNEAVQVASFR